MSQKRVIFLALVFVILYCIAYFAQTRPDDTTQESALTPDATISQSPEQPRTLPVYFVPVITYRNPLPTDLADVADRIFVATEYYEAIQDASVWEELRVEPVPGDAALFDTTPEADTVLLVPLSAVTPNYRILTVRDKSIFDHPNEWPFTFQLATDVEQITPDMVQEVVFGGTVVLSRGVAERIEKYNDVFYPWTEIADTLKAADYAFLNFKGAITSDCVYDGYTMTFCGEPGYLKGMADAGVDGVSVSGNHIGDYGQTGMAETIQFLDEYSFAHTGLGNNYASAVKPVITTLGDTTIGILAYNNVPGTSPCATNDVRWSITCLSDEETVRRDIEVLSEEVDIVVMYPNWGPEYVHTPHATAQVEWGRFFVEAGADIVLGDQAHWVQTMELYQGVPIYYGLGNIVFDQMWSDKTTEGLLVKVYVANGKILTTEPLATKIYDYAQPRIETGDLRDMILSYLTLPVGN